jgi:MYXO-CTERM domain-containing protein
MAGINMKASIYTAPLLAAFFSTPSLAGLISLGSAENFTIVANTYNSGGDGSTVHGNVIAKTYASTGNGSTINGDYRSGDVLTLGDGATVNGNAESKGAGSATANTLVTGNLVTGGVGTMGDTARVEGNFISGLDGTIGANAISTGNWEVGAGSVAAASASSNKINGDAVDTDTAYLNSVLSTIENDMIAATDDLIAAKAALSAMASTEPTLAPTFVTSGTLYAGVYEAASWSTTAGTTLTLDGQGQDDATWVFNIDDILAFGGVSKVELFDVGDNAQVFWNVGSVASPGGYATVGDGADILGIITAEDYVMVGANATVQHASADYGNCAGVYSTTSYVSVGDSAVVGGAGCSPTSEPQPPGPVPVPVSGTNALLLAGLGLMAFGRRRRFKKAA